MSQGDIFLVVLLSIMSLVMGLVIPLWFGIWLYKRGHKWWAIATFVSIPLGGGLICTSMCLTLVICAIVIVLGLAPFALILKALGVPIGYYGLFHYRDSATGQLYSAYQADRHKIKH